MSGWVVKRGMGIKDGRCMERLNPDAQSEHEAHCPVLANKLVCVPDKRPALSKIHVRTNNSDRTDLRAIIVIPLHCNADKICFVNRSLMHN